MSFGTDMARLRKLTTEQLHARREAVIAAATRPEPHGIYLYDAKSRKKLELIARAISERIERAAK